MQKQLLMRPQLQPMQLLKKPKKPLRMLKQHSKPRMIRKPPRRRSSKMMKKSSRERVPRMLEKLLAVQLDLLLTLKRKLLISKRLLPLPEPKQMLLTPQAHANQLPQLYAPQLFAHQLQHTAHQYIHHTQPPISVTTAAAEMQPCHIQVSIIYKSKCLNI